LQTPDVIILQLLITKLAKQE